MLNGCVLRVNPHINVNSHLSPRTRAEVFPVIFHKADGSTVEVAVKDLKKDLYLS